ncbi:GMC oxidoreductase [Trametes maxima]|nr:GMC oxidoreductase [Trametes maxima]
MATAVSPEEFSSLAFDYLVVGGGTAGLVLATRLSEDSSISIGVIEAGECHPEAEGISIPGLCGSLIGHPQFDWDFITVPQRHANNRQISQPRGKALGGSSTVRSRWQHDGEVPFEELGNPGWNWGEFIKYMRKSETTSPLTPGIPPEYDLVSPEPEVHGDAGPLVKSYPTVFNSLHLLLTDAMEALGVPRNAEPCNGSNAGSSITFATVDPHSATRTCSMNAYYEPIANRKNLVVITGSRASRVKFLSGSSPLVAMGVEFIKDGRAYNVKARKEVILSAGAFQTPQILELSGIGNRTVLCDHGIETLLDLPGVGENLRKSCDHEGVITIHEIDPAYETVDLLQDPDEVALQRELYEAKKGVYSSAMATLLGFLPLKSFATMEQIHRWKAATEEAIRTASTAGIRKQLELQLRWLDDDASAEGELIPYPGFFLPSGLKPEPNARYSSIVAAAMHPLSRGSVHIASFDPTVSPAIDPNYFANPVDLEVLLAIVRFTLKLYQTSPLADVTHRPIVPSPAQSATDEALTEFIKDNCKTVYHPLGTAAMQPQEDGGVVDPELKVYGTANLRVVRYIPRSLLDGAG